ncbi:MAG TPA: bifunctional DNA-formamidopyrimidine glycosylase/DNA-(apurinic or apyrimidinic site) lyase [bacterium]|nr:bifunctional DNA-formamidopyrimidine glycosylase/DNA-(apurinic or apyrimidinic site) lyase [bacterium]
MPELPEVETIKNDLKSNVIRKKIVSVDLGKPRIVKNRGSEFKKQLVGNEFIDISRIGKLLIISLKRGGLLLLVHLKMTGQLIYCHQGKYVAGGHSLPKLGSSLPNKYSHVIFKFTDNSKLFFNDLRQFGYLQLIKRGDLKKVTNNYGIEPLQFNFKPERLAEIFKKRTAPVKSLLLNQKLIAGIGNIYADEVLFAAGVLPDRQAKSLSNKEVKKIFVASQKIIALAIKHRGTTFNDYVDADGNVGSFVKFLKVYGRQGKTCFRCGATVKKTKVAGRGTHFCPECQK